MQDVLLAPLNWPGGQLEHAADATPVAAFTSVLPTPHEEHDEDPAPEYCPEPQLSQEDDSSEDENLPAAHSLQVVLPDSLNLPATQTSHASDSTPVSASTSRLPSGQEVHSLLSIALNHPDAQLLQLLLEDELKVPAGHSSQASSSLPVSTWTRCFPAAQVEQAGALEPEYLPAVQWPHAMSASAVSESARNLPASHSVHSTEPLPLCWPGSHEEQAPALTPVAAFTRSLPTEHVEHDGDPAPEYWPTPQSSQNDDSEDDENLAGAQSLHSALLARLNVPASHDEQALLSLAVAESTRALPSVHATQASLVAPEYWPGAQSEQASLASALNEPAEQDAHAADSSSVAVTTRLLPAPQLVHSALLSPE